MSYVSADLVASGNIRTCRFVSISGDFAGAESNSGDEVIGISRQGANQAPLSDLSITEYAAQSGEPIQMYGPGAVCLLTLGGSVSAGNLLKSDNDGAGVVIGGSGAEKVGAVALQDGTSGQKILVQVRPGRIYT